MTRTSEVITDPLVNQHFGRDLELILAHGIAAKEKIVQASGGSRSGAYLQRSFENGMIR